MFKLFISDFLPFSWQMGFYKTCNKISHKKTPHSRDLIKKTITAFFWCGCVYMCWEKQGRKSWLGYTEVLLLFSSNWEEASCVLLKTEILEEWVDCRGVSTVPCLRVQVNLTDSNQTAFLHFDEELVLHALEVGI